MNSYTVWYEQITAWFRKNPQRIWVLNTLNRALTMLMYGVYPLLLILLVIEKDRRFWKVFLIPAVSFVLITWIRSVVNRKRPYEASGIDPLIHKDTRGKSMPSRHVFSSSMISSAWYFICPPAGIALYVVSALSAVVRVLGGVHYPSDVAAGFLAGAACGLFFLI